MNKKKLIPALIAICLTAFVALALASLSAEVFETYGGGIFIGTPIVCGALSSWIYNRSGSRKLRESLSVALIAGVITLLGFVFVGFEGLICLAMAIPVVLPLFLLGGLIGYYLSKRLHKRTHSGAAILFMIVCLPLFMGFESSKSSEPKLRNAVTSVQINASKEAVWQEVIQFSTIPEPKEFLFRIGIAYPTDARIEGSGVGAIRYCNFSTGSFVEPITVWEEGRELAFDVSKQPVPLTEISPYTGLHPPHLDWVVRSVKGQFLITENAEGGITLTGTTWFYTKMAPEAYWSWLTEKMVHAIHRRVLEHIKLTVEAENPSSNL